VNFSGNLFNIVGYGVDPETETIDLDALRATALEHRPKMIVGGYSAYSQIIDWAAMREIADEVDAIFLVDAAHIIGLIAGIIVVVSVLAFDKIKIDDPVGAISVHGVCGIWGILACALFDTTESGYTIVGQLTGVVAVGAAAFIFSFALFFIIKLIMGVRVSEEEEAEGLDVAEHGSPAYTD
jgi:Amt family ammonium transporter